MPTAHCGHLGWTPSTLIAWGRKVGPHAASFIERLLETRGTTTPSKGTAAASAS